jgi:hypothetical protein
MSVNGLASIATMVEEIFPAKYLNLPNPLVFTNLGDLPDIAFRQWLLTENAPRSILQGAVNLFRYPPGVIVDRDASYLTCVDSVLIAEQLPWWQTETAALATDLEHRAANAPRVPAPCLLIARYGETKWGHWSCEMLPKLALAEILHPKRFTYVVPAKITMPNDTVGERYVAAIMESIHAFGVEPYRLLRLPLNTPLRFDALFDMDGISSDAMHPAVARAMRSHINIPARKDLPRKIAILRNDAAPRTAINSTEILALAGRHGYSSVDIASLPFRMQAALFFQADSIIANLGSELAATIYAQPELRVLTIAPGGWYDGYFVKTLQRQAAFHADVRGITLGPGHGAVGQAPFYVDSKAVHNGLEALMRNDLSDAANAGFVLDGAPVPRQLGPTRLQIRFGNEGNASQYQAEGWSDAENSLTWSIGPASTLTLPRAPLQAADLWMELRCKCFTAPPALPAKPLTPIVNGTTLDTKWLGYDAILFWKLPAALLKTRGPIKLRFEHPVCPSPQSIGVSPDPRPLGFAFTDLKFHDMAGAE